MKCGYLVKRSGAHLLGVIYYDIEMPCFLCHDEISMVSYDNKKGASMTPRDGYLAIRRGTHHFLDIFGFHHFLSFE